MEIAPELTILFFLYWPLIYFHLGLSPACTSLKPFHCGLTAENEINAT
jgi:hypothetical protein